MLRSLIGVAATVSFCSAAVTLNAQAPGEAAARSAAAAKKAPAAAGKHTAGSERPGVIAILQGTWDYRTITPLERPQNMGDRQFLTDAEAATLEARAAKRLDEPPDGSVPANTIHAPYWTDPGRRAARRQTHIPHHQSAGRPPAAADAGRPSKPATRRADVAARAAARAARRTAPKIAARSSAASRRACPPRICRRSTTTT